MFLNVHPTFHGTIPAESIPISGIPFRQNPPRFVNKSHRLSLNPTFLQIKQAEKSGLKPLIHHEIRSFDENTCFRLSGAIGIIGTIFFSPEVVPSNPHNDS